MKRLICFFLGCPMVYEYDSVKPVMLCKRCGRKVPLI